MNPLAFIAAIAPYVLQFLADIPGFAKTIEQFRADLQGHPDLTPDQKVAALKQAKADVDAADDEVQAVDAPPVPDPDPTPNMRGS